MKHAILLFQFIILNSLIGVVAQDSATFLSQIQTINQSKAQDRDSLIYEIDQIISSLEDTMPMVRIQAYSTKARLYFGLAQIDSSIIAFGEALDIAIDVKDSAKIGTVLNWLGSAYKEKGNFSEAVDYFERALEIGRAYDKEQLMAVSLMNLGTVSLRLGDLEGAEEYFRLANAYWSNNDTNGLKAFKINYGNLLSQLGRRDEARALYVEALNLAKKTNDDWRLSICYNNIADLHFRDGRYEESIRNFKDALTLSSNEGGMQIQLFANIGIAMNMLELGELDSALYYSRKASEAPLPEQAHHLHKELAITYSIVFEERNELDSALFYARLVDQLNDSMQIEHFASKLAELQMDSRLAAQSKELDLARDLQEEQQFGIMMRNIALGILLVLFSVGAWLSVRQQRLNLLLKQKEARLRKNSAKITQQNIELEQLNQTKNRLFSILGHDLRAPLTALNGLVNIWKDRTVQNESEREIFNELQDSLYYMSQTLDNVLHWAREQMNKEISVEPKRFDLNKEASDVLSLYRYVAKKKGVTLNSEETDATVFCDVDHFQLILRNLITNAIKYTPTGKSVTVLFEETMEVVKLTVSDEGVGMSEQQLADLRGGFTLKSTYGTSDEKGTGLGLALVMDYARLNEIEIDVESSLGRGTQVTLSIPK